MGVEPLAHRTVGVSSGVLGRGHVVVDVDRDEVSQVPGLLDEMLVPGWVMAARNEFDGRVLLKQRLGELPEPRGILLGRQTSVDVSIPDLIAHFPELDSVGRWVAVRRSPSPPFAALRTVGVLQPVQALSKRAL